MAEIPVEHKERKGGLPWWLIPLLLLLLLIPMLFFLARGCNDNAGVVGNTNGNGNVNRAVATTNYNAGATATTTTNATNANGSSTMTNAGTGNGNSSISVDNRGTATGDRVTDVNLFGSAADKATLVGRGAQLTNVKVNRVLSDHVFTVTSGKGEMFVYLDEGQDTTAGSEKAVKIRPGQQLNLNGEFRRVPNAEIAAERNEKRDGSLSDKEYAQMKGQQVYLHAQASQ